MEYKCKIKKVSNKKKNLPKKAVEIYSDILAIEAKKGKNSLWPNEIFRHDFTEKGTKIYGLEDGSLLIKGKKRLWKKFKNYKKGIDF